MIIRPNLLSNSQLIFLSKSKDISIIELITSSGIDITEEELVLINNINNGYPIEYALGYAEVNNHKIAVNQKVLLPRWETEEWVTNICNRLSKINENFVCVDLGCGSGIISRLFTQNFPKSPLICVDSSVEALDITEENLRKIQTEKHFITSNWLDNPLIVDKLADRNWILLCNPPYVPIEDKLLKQEHNIVFEPESAIFSGIDGLDDFKIILEQLDNIRIQPLILCFELDPRNIDNAQQLFTSKHPDYITKIIIDSAGYERVLVAALPIFGHIIDI